MASQVQELKRASGVLMHVSSLPGSDSIGCFGKEARDFIDFLADSGFSWWQVLPFCMADDCHSPYKSFSAFGGNPYFIDLRILRDRGLLTKAEVAAIRESSPYACDFRQLESTRMGLLARAAARVSEGDRADIRAFIAAHPYLAQCCEFMALRATNNHLPWKEWTRDVPDEDELFLWQFIQYHFMMQWEDIHRYAARRGIKILGDMPIYVAYDSCDVWANRDLFDLDENDAPRHVAGCPPDYFSADGQLWGNPLYDWERMKEDDYTWWSDRMAHMLELFDGVRIDHFRALEAYWAIPADASTARDGRWIPGPGQPFVRRMREVAEKIRSDTGRDALIVAEDLGETTPSLKKFLEESTFPGMRVIQFAFDGDHENPHLPHQLVKNTVAYTGTHDNNTLLGFIWESDPATRRHLLDYCGYTAEDWNSPAAYEAIIRTLYASAAGLVILPIQDVLLYGADCRMNTPGRAEGNWQYRVTKEQLDSIDRGHCRHLNELYGRLSCR